MKYNMNHCSSWPRYCSDSTAIMKVTISSEVKGNDATATATAGRRAEDAGQRERQCTTAYVGVLSGRCRLGRLFPHFARLMFANRSCPG